MLKKTNKRFFTEHVAVVMLYLSYYNITVKLFTI